MGYWKWSLIARKFPWRAERVFQRSKKAAPQLVLYNSLINYRQWQRIIIDVV